MTSTVSSGDQDGFEKTEGGNEIVGRRASNTIGYAEKRAIKGSRAGHGEASDSGSVTGACVTGIHVTNVKRAPSGTRASINFRWRNTHIVATARAEIGVADRYLLNRGTEQLVKLSFGFAKAAQAFRDSQASTLFVDSQAQEHLPLPLITHIVRERLNACLDPEALLLRRISQSENETADESMADKEKGDDDNDDDDDADDDELEIPYRWRFVVSLVCFGLDEAMNDATAKFADCIHLAALITLTKLSLPPCAFNNDIKWWTPDQQSASQTARLNRPVSDCRAASAAVTFEDAMTHTPLVVSLIQTCARRSSATVASSNANTDSDSTKIETDPTLRWEVPCFSRGGMDSLSSQDRRLEKVALGLLTLRYPLGKSSGAARGRERQGRNGTARAVASDFTKLPLPSSGRLGASVLSDAESDEKWARSKSEFIGRSYHEVVWGMNDPV